MEEKKKIVIYVDEVREFGAYPEIDPYACWDSQATLELHILLKREKVEEALERIRKEYLGQ